MKRTHTLFAAALLAALPSAGKADGVNRVYVDVAEKGKPVAANMYGLFFEEINHAGEGGLYGEMLQNRGFEEQTLPGGMTYRDGRAYAPHSLNYYGLDYVDSWVTWDIEARKYWGWQVNGIGCRLDKDVAAPDVPLHENTPNALRLRISDATEGSKVNVDNTGFYTGLSVKMGGTYKLRFYLRTADYEGDVKAMLCNKAGEPMSSVEVKAVDRSGDWTEYRAELTASATLTDARFRLQFLGNGNIDVDYVSLFPTDTYKGRENGMRRDVAEILEAMHPTFLRWPGGCVVEGITLENRVKWKETIGDPMTRPGEFSLWGYRNNYGFGYHEFLQFCEDMGMDAMYVGNVGLSCCLRNGDFVPADDTETLETYLQDFRDAIEYAIGDPNTNEWAAKRAAAGHPEPFPLKYVELGNENGTPRYHDRYAFFHNTLKAEYPQLTFINTLVWGERDQLDKVDMFDVHWYVTPDEFYDQATLFDEVERRDFTVYAGEYAVNNGVGTGNMDAALAEAVFTGGMERNGDLVTMASYAPLLGNVNEFNWACNLIWFDNDRVMGRASYYVQQLFAQNRPDYNVKTRIQSNRQKQLTRGRIGLGTWNTKAEFRNVKVTSQDGSETFYESDFNTHLSDWSRMTGTWRVTRDGAYAQTADGTPCMSVMNALSLGNCTLELEAKKTSGAEGFLIVFGADTLDYRDHYRFNIGGWGNAYVGVEQVTDGNGKLVGERVPFRLQDNKWYKIKVVLVEGQKAELYMDDKLVLSYAFSDILPGRVQAFGGYDEKAGEVVVKVVNATNEDMPTAFRLNAANIQAEGKVLTLAAESLADENTLDNPTKIAPVESTFDGFAPEFEYTVPARSFVVMRVKADAEGLSPIEIPAYNYNDRPLTLYGPIQERKQAREALETLVNYAGQSLVEGLDGSDDVKSALEPAKDLLAEEAPSADDMNDAAAKLRAVLTAYFKAQMKDDNDLTSRLKNPDFSTMQTTGWLGSMPALQFNVGEFFNCTFDMYQTLTNLENGYYLLYVQGYYRNGGTLEAYETWQHNEEKLLARFYGNDAETTLVSLYSGGKGLGGYKGYCDNREQAEKAFKSSADLYANYLVAQVTNGRLRIGLRKTEACLFDWTCFNNFKVFKLNPKGDAVTAVRRDVTDEQAVYTLSGIRLPDGKKPAKGIYIRGGKKILAED